MALLDLDSIDKSFGDHTVLRGVSLQVAEGEMLALLGPSGSGKTTLLRILAGFESADGGRIELAGEDVTRVSPARRGVGMVFQHYALFPHLDVGANVAFGLKSLGLSGDEAAERVAEVLGLVDLSGFERRAVGELSGGQQQRVAVARALAPRPRLLLLDEPLSNLDPMLRERTRRALRQLVRQVGITTVLVTHEQQEAFDLGDRIALLTDGQLQQVGPPDELYERPANRFVATFVGRRNLLSGRLDSRRGRLGVRLEGVAGEPWWPGVDGGVLEGDEGRVELMLRPEALRLVDSPSDGSVAGTVLERLYGGGVSHFRVALEVDAASGGDPEPIEVEVLARSDAASVGDRVQVAPQPAGPPGRIWSSARPAVTHR